MTVSSETAKSGPYVGNGVATDFPYNFRILDAAHIEVIRTVDGMDTTVSSSEYTVSGVGSSFGGNVTFAFPPASTHSITIIRNAPFTQQTDLENQGAYYAETIEEALDLAAMRDQQLAEELGRAVKVPVGSTLAFTPEELAQNILFLADLYLGAFPSAPSVDNHGDPLKVGAVYWDTVSSQMFVWSGSEWKPTFLTGNAVRALVTATAGQTVVSVPTYIVGQNTISVFLNGLKVMVDDDYTETDQNTITFLSALAEGDEVETVTLQPYAIGTADASNITTVYGVSLARLFELRDGTVAELLADTTLNPAVIPMGSIIEAGGFRYEVATVLSADYHAVTAGGLKLYVLPGPGGVIVPEQFSDFLPDMTASIQAAVDLALSNGGGVVRLNPLEYIVSDSITIEGNITIEGTAPSFFRDYELDALELSGSWITMAPGSNKSVIVVDYTGPALPGGSYPRIHTRLANLGIHGNRSGNPNPVASVEPDGTVLRNIDRNSAGSGIDIRGASYVTIEGVKVLRAADHGILAATAVVGTNSFRSSNNILIRDTVCIGNGLDGFNLSGGDSKLLGIVGGYNGRHGYSGSMGPIVGGMFWNNYWHGLVIRGFGIAVTGVNSYDNGRTGIRIEDAGDNWIVGDCRLYDNGRNGAGPGLLNDAAGLAIASAAGAGTVTGCVFNKQHDAFRIAFAEIEAPGSGYTNGTYTAVPLTGGTGSEATADITVTGGVVTAFAMVSRGGGYTAGDILSAPSLPGGAGFQLEVTVVSYPFPANQLYGIAATSGAPRLTVAGCTFERLVEAYAITDASNCRFDVPTYPTRAALVADWANVPPGVTVYAGRLPYQNIGTGTVIPDLPGFVPVAPVYPDHWATNVTPGTTDMTAAIQAALNYAPTVELFEGDYRVSGMIRTYARNGKRLIGRGKQVSRIVADTGSYDVLRFYTGQTNASGVPLSCRGVELRDLTITSSGVQRTGGWLVAFEERCSYGVFTDVLLDNAFNGLDLTAASYTHVDRLFIEGTQRTTTGGTALRLSSSELAGVYDPNSLAGGAKPTDCHFVGLQINQQNVNGLENPYAISVLIEAADGLYFKNGHIRGGTNAVVLRTALAPNRHVVASVDFSQVYFDGVEGSHVRFEGFGNGHSFTQSGGTTPITVKFRSIKFNDCRFRAARGTQGSVTFSNMDASSTGKVERVSFRGGQMRDNRYSGFRDASATGWAKGIIIEGVEFSGNNWEGSSTHGDIYMRSERHRVSNNVFEPGDVNTDVGYHIRLLAGTLNNSEVSGNNFVDSPITVIGRRIEAQATDRVFDNEH